MLVLTLTAIATGAYFTLFDVKKIITKAEGEVVVANTSIANTKISAISNDIIDYGKDGVLVYLSAQGPSKTIGDASTMTSPVAPLAATLDSYAIKYTMTVSNASNINKVVKLKFKLPPGFTFWDMVSGASNPDGITGTHTNGTGNYETLYWSNYTAKPGEFDVVFRVTPPIVAP